MSLEDSSLCQIAKQSCRQMVCGGYAVTSLCSLPISALRRCKCREARCALRGLRKDPLAQTTVMLVLVLWRGGESWRSWRKSADEWQVGNVCLCVAAASGFFRWDQFPPSLYYMEEGLGSFSAINSFTCQEQPWMSMLVQAQKKGNFSTRTRSRALTHWWRRWEWAQAEMQWTKGTRGEKRKSIVQT